MRLFSYCIPVDDGAAPNPFFGACTLAICKPVIRRVANIGDWVVGVGSKNVSGIDYSGKIVYAMKVTQKMTLEEYDSYCLKLLPNKIPNINHEDYKRQVGDCIYRYKEGEIIQLSGVHNEHNVDTDLNGKNVLLSKHFYYFGDKCIDIPDEFKSIIKQGQGHKSNANDCLKQPFIIWLESQNFILNYLYGRPQIKLKFKINGLNECASVRCISAKRDVNFSNSYKKKC